MGLSYNERLLALAVDYEGTIRDLQLEVDEEDHDVLKLVFHLYDAGRKAAMQNVSEIPDLVEHMMEGSNASTLEKLVASMKTDRKQLAAFAATEFNTNEISTTAYDFGQAAAKSPIQLSTVCLNYLAEKYSVSRPKLKDRDLELYRQLISDLRT